MIGETEMQIFVKKTDRNTNAINRNIYSRCFDRRSLSQ